MKEDGYSVLVLKTADLMKLELLKKVEWVYVGDLSDMNKQDQDEELESIRDIFNNIKE